MDVWGRLRQGLAKTQARLGESLSGILGRRGAVDPAMVESLEEALLAADVGPATTEKLIAGAREKMKRQDLSLVAITLVPGADFSNVVVFNSLSKRSNLPGIRVGLAVGDKKFITKFVDYRNVVAPQVPGPLQDVAAAAYGDEAHVEENRRLYRLKYDLADQIIGDRYGYKRPPGGFFLWLDVSAQGGDEQASKRLWRDGGLRVIPGHYLARDGADGSNPGTNYIRVALVQDKETTAEALHRLVAVLG